MDKKLLQQLVEASYKGTELQKEVVEKIATKLNRSQLKAYIRALKAKEKSLTVTVTIPAKTIETKSIESVFKGKNVVYREDPSLLLGVTIEDNDLIWDMSLKNRFNSLLSHIEE